MQMVRQGLCEGHVSTWTLHAQVPARRGRPGQSEPSAEDLLILRCASAFRAVIMPRNGPQIPVI